MAISGDTAVIGDVDDNERSSNSNSGYCYVYTKIGGKWIENCQIVPGDGAAND